MPPPVGESGRHADELGAPDRAADIPLLFDPERAARLIGIPEISNAQGEPGAVGESKFHLDSCQPSDDTFYAEGGHPPRFSGTVEASSICVETDFVEESS